MKFSIKKHQFLLISFVLLIVTIFGFQNCSPTKFVSVGTVSQGLAVVPVSPVCDLSTRLADFENLQCLPPNENQLLARQFYNVICKENGQWDRTTRGSTDYSQCPNSCAGVRPSDIENVFCPAPNSALKNGTLRYQVTCSQDGTWSRTVSGSADYTTCPMVCDPNLRPSTTGAVACPAPNSSLLSGIQNYNVVCHLNGSWGRTVLGGADYSQCPQSCDPNLRPANTANEVCPNSSDVKAVRSYNVICLANGTWSRTPTTLDTSLCPSPTCDPNTRPGAQDTIACPAPFAASILSKQNYSISCSGTSWVRTPTTRDDSQCPKACGTPPANDFTLLACQSPFQSSILAKQNYTFSCNPNSGQFIRTALGPVDYNACPKSCAGPNPAGRATVSCPVGFTGTAYQNYSSTCNTATGQWTTPIATTLDTSGCSATSCTGPKPSDFDPAACPAPFQSRMDAKRMYSAAVCSGGVWVRGAPTGVIDTSSCPANDCSGSANPGTEKDRGQCPGGASGRIFQTCSLTCTGNTYSQTNCSADNYSRCDCGANATFNPATRTCVSALTYAWDPYAISRGTCSATACGTSGTQSGTYTTCRRSDGAIVSASYCGSNVAPPIACSAAACVSCAGGSADVQSAANNLGTTTTCSFSWNSALAGQNAVVTRATNGGNLTGQCGANGDWANVVSSCPKPADAAPTIVWRQVAGGSPAYLDCDMGYSYTGGTISTSGHTWFTAFPRPTSGVMAYAGPQPYINGNVKYTYTIYNGFWDDPGERWQVNAIYINDAYFFNCRSSGTGSGL